MIHVQHVSKSVTDKVLFEDISFKIGDGQKVGLVGPNGAGKTTLLNILLGNEDADSGIVAVNNETIGYLPQKLITQPNEEIGEYLRSRLLEEWEEYKIDEALAKVGLKGINTKTLILKLSGGQKMKVALAGVLLVDPTVLFLDEPTNNLDLESIIWLEQFVKNFDGKVLLISHDRYFLDACVNKIIELNPFTKKTTEYGGNYSSYKVQKQLNEEHQLADYERQQQKEAHMREWIAEKQQQLKFHPSNKVARQLQAMKTRLEREVTDEQLEKPQEYTSFKIASVGDQLHKGKTVISLFDFKIYELMSAEELHIFGQERINLHGSNGSGKTTFIKSIIGQNNFYSGKVEIGPDIKLGYFSQEHELLHLDDTVINVFINQTNRYDEAKARSILGKFLFTKQKVFSQIKNLSEGEKARLLIAIIIHQNNDFLLLDEPTNHLDLESREVLAEALQEYEGGFLVISHDRYFLEQIGIDRTLTINKQILS